MLRLDPPAEELSPEPPVNNRRRFPRLQLPLRCWLIGGSHTMYLRVHDVSRDGLSVRAPVPFHPADQLTVRLELADGINVEARAEVVWTRAVAEGATGPRMGARFVEVSKGKAALHEALPGPTRRA